MDKGGLHTAKDIKQLLSQIAIGDRAAFGCIYRLFYNKLYRYGSILSPNLKLVEDTIQDLFLWILEHPDKLENIKNLEIYLFQSLKRNLREQAKTKGRRQEILHQVARQPSLPKLTNSVEVDFIQRENLSNNKNWVQQKLDELPAHQKEILYLRYYEGLSYEEITQIIPTSNQVIRNYVSRAIKQLKKLGSTEKFLSFYLFFQGF